VLLVVGYTAAWFYAAGRFEEAAKRAIADLNRDDVSAECVNPVARGFPFRLGLFCDSISLADAGQGVSLNAGSFRSAAQIYNPWHIVGELDGPARVEAPGVGAVDFRWDGLHASTRLAEPLPVRTSVEAKAISASREGAGLFAAENAQAHMMPAGADLNVFVSFKSLSLDSALLDGRDLPPLTGSADVSMKDGVAFAVSGARDLRGHSGTIREITLSTGEGSFTLAGDIAVDQDGLIDARLQLAITNLTALMKVAEQAFPEARDNIRNASGALMLLGQNPKMPLKITKGRATLGFIPLGRIPPLL
jgi:hypothetical protein